MRTLPLSLFGLLALVAPATLVAGPIVIDFEGLPDSTILTNQYVGVTFSNAIILTAGISLNEFEFPPHSGSNVASDNSGPMTISFASPLASFSGYFTYAKPLTVQAFNEMGVAVGMPVTSLFSSNLACLAGPPCSGDPGSSPDELMQVANAGGIASVAITGDPGGGSFALDDAALNPLPASGVPEPAGWSLLLIGGVLLVLFRGSAIARLPN